MQQKTPTTMSTAISKTRQKRFSFKGRSKQGLKDLSVGSGISRGLTGQLSRKCLIFCGWLILRRDC